MNGLFDRLTGPDEAWVSTSLAASLRFSPATSSPRIKTMMLGNRG
jgi:hypothetical protein